MTITRGLFSGTSCFGWRACSTSGMENHHHQNINVLLLFGFVFFCAWEDDHVFSRCNHENLWASGTSPIPHAQRNMVLSKGLLRAVGHDPLLIPAIPEGAA